MKAYIKEEHEHKGRFNGHKYRLTVAMPVSNQVKTIRRCLDSLVPLLKAVPSELIITDTGSTDGTIEICREYTDHIENFPWCDDMSAARNVGMKAAQGEWFLSIDDDEWFENVDEIIEFFNSGECDNYSSASYIQRNYLKLDGSYYLDHHTPRIVRLIGDIHFEGRIHDTIINRYHPTKYFHSYVHHYGFAFVDRESRLAKFRRNVSGLQKDIEEFPTELRFIYQMIKEYATIGEFKTAIEWGLKGLAIEKEYPNKGRRCEITVQVIKCYYADSQFQMAADMAEKFLADDQEIEIYHMDVYWLQMFAYMGLGQYEKGVQAALGYFATYKQFKAGKLDNEALLIGGSDSMMPRSYADALFAIAKCYTHLNEYECAVEYFDRIDLYEIDLDKFPIILLGINIAAKKGKYERIADLYIKIQQTNDEKKQNDFIEVIEDYIKKEKHVRTDIVKALAQVKSDCPYVQLNKLRCADEDENHEETRSLIGWFVDNFKEWNPYYADVLYISMKQDVDITPFIDLFDVEDLQLYTAQIISNHLDFATVTIYYFLKHSYNDSLKGLYWSICLRERVVLFSEGMSFEQYVNYFKGYSLDVGSYAHQIYQSKMFTEENISILPRAYRFGHYASLAFDAYQSGDELAYVRNFKIALQHYPIMKGPIGTLLKYLEEIHKIQDERAQTQNEEFSKLANEVKTQIEQFLLQKQYEQAAAVLAELAEMLPQDEDVKRYRLQIQSALAPKEIGTKIPQ
ncbi:MAG TPA: glycosyltransferase [Oscillospiraceae bacterium]|nr:glycosyltransferase [Oscillospiraceae bacterium]